jgi:hypothetical protein
MATAADRAAIGMGVVGMAPIGYWLSDWIPWVALVRAFHGVSIAAFATAYVTWWWILPQKKNGVRSWAT